MSANLNLAVHAFNGGEVSPMLYGRSDLDSMKRACYRCLNYVLPPTGGAFRAPPTLHVATTPTASRVIPFNVGADVSFVLEIGHLSIKFWNADGTLARERIDAPWSAAQLDALQLVQVNDVIFFTHPQAGQHELLRQVGNVWTLRPIPWKWAALRDVNVSADTLTFTPATGTAPFPVGTTGALVASNGAAFTADHVGSVYALGHYRRLTSSVLTLLPRAAAYPAVSDPAASKIGDMYVSPPVYVRGKWSFSTTGRWKGETMVLRENAASGWDVVQRVTGDLDTNRNIAGIEEDGVRMRVAVANFFAYPAGGTVSAPEIPAPSMRLENTETEAWGVVRIDSVTGGTTATATVVSGDVHSTAATSLWREGAWSKVRGYPRAVAMHDQRLIFGGTASDPQKLWGSTVGDFRNFEDSVYEDSAWIFQVAAQESNPILWIASQSGGLIAGTRGDEWLLEGGERGITPSSIRASRKSAYGSSPVQPILAGSATLFVQRGAMTLLEYIYDFNSANYIAPDLTQLVEHMTRGGIRGMAYARNPWSSIYVVTNDGHLRVCTYSRAESIVAWSRLDVGGTVQSVAVAYGPPGQADEVWISVKRGDVYSVERFDPQHWQRLHSAGNVWHAYSAVKVTATGGVAGGLAHLAGQKVSLVANGIDQGERQVSPLGQVSSPDGEAIVGIVVDAEISPFIGALQLQDGTSDGRPWRMPELVLRLYHSRLGRYSAGAAEYGIISRDAVHVADAAPPLFSGDRKVNTGGTYTDQPTLVIKSSGTQPLNILALFPKAAVYGS